MPNYTPATGKCVVVTIEAVFTVDEDRGTAVDNALTELKGCGAAEVVSVKLIGDLFSEASLILNKRRVANET